MMFRILVSQGKTTFQWHIYSAIFVQKNYWNRTTTVEIIVGGCVLSFFETHCTLQTRSQRQIYKRGIRYICETCAVGLAPFFFTFHYLAMPLEEPEKFFSEFGAPNFVGVAFGETV